MDNPYKPGIFRWSRIPAEEKLGRKHTDLVKVVNIVSSEERPGFILIEFKDKFHYVPNDQIDEYKADG